jgi:kinesin family protein 16B
MFCAGYNASVLAYGQTGSGKTHSMFGTKDDPGLVPRMCSELWSRCSAKQTLGQNYVIQIAMLEIYNEEIFDLLAPCSSRKSLQLRDDGHSVGVEGLIQMRPDSVEGLIQTVSDGFTSRSTKSTDMNAMSSRSHAICYLSGPSGTPLGAVALCDLAGAERARTRGEDAALIKESNFINLSLSVLNRCIKACVDGQILPVRESKLTHLLRECFGGKNKTCLLATLNPQPSNLFRSPLESIYLLSPFRLDLVSSSGNHGETLNTLHYARLARSMGLVAKALKQDLVGAANLIRDLQKLGPQLKRFSFNMKRLAAEMKQSMDQMSMDDMSNSTVVVSASESKSGEELELSMPVINPLPSKCIAR